MGTVLWQDEAGNDVKLRSVSGLVDNALEAIENSNAKLKGILNRISQYQLDSDKLIGLINTSSDTSFTKPVFAGEALELQSKDILAMSTNTFWASSRWPKANKAASTTRPKAP